jgi:hypothetical protein
LRPLSLALQSARSALLINSSKEYIFGRFRPYFCGDEFSGNRTDPKVFPKAGIIKMLGPVGAKILAEKA